jgi:hypothetical protein
MSHTRSIGDSTVVKPAGSFGCSATAGFTHFNSGSCGEQSFDFLHKLGLSKRLVDNSRLVDRVALDRLLSVACTKQNLETGPHLACLPRQLHAIHARHDDVGEQQIN